LEALGEIYENPAWGGVIIPADTRYKALQYAGPALVETRRHGRVPEEDVPDK
jgi:hypothetical protein